MTEISLAQVAEMTSGQLHGDTDLPIRGAGTLDAARSDEITFADSPRALEQLRNSQAAAAIVPRDVIVENKPFIQVSNVREAFATIVSHFRQPRVERHIGISPAARISPTAMVASDVDIHPGAVIGDDVRIGSGSRIHANVVLSPGCQIAEDVTIFPNAVLYEDTVVGPRVVIHAGAVLGAYGFGYDLVDGRHVRGAQLGYVHIQADVEIGAGTTIDRGTYGPTVIGEGTKIDNLVMIAHNCHIGRHNMICSQVGVAGSSSTGDYVVMAGQVGVPDHIRIGDRAILGAKSGIMRDVPDGATMLGIPATPERDQMHKQAALARLPEMRKQLRALQRAVGKLTGEASERSEAA